MSVKALFTGSFDPLTMGHLNIVERASKLFDEVTVGIVVNYSKTSMFTLEERVEMITDAVSHLDNVKVDSFSGLLANHVNKRGYNVIVRGLRSGVDFDYELQMEQMNSKLLNEDVETVYLITSPEYAFVSSSLMKEVHKLGGSIDGMVPQNILEKMDAKLAEGK